MHLGKLPPNLLAYILIIIGSDTVFEHAWKIWHSLSRDDYAWISARCAHCNKEKVQKNNARV
jgi:hypothetical protein